MMMEFLNFTFDSFWHFIGVLTLLTTVVGALSSALRVVFIRGSWSVVEPRFRKTIVGAIREAGKP